VPTFHFLFSDIEGSTRLWEAHPETMQTALAMHDQQIRTAIEDQGGVVFKNTGDGAAAVFESSASALLAAVAAQRLLAGTDHPEIGRLKARMAIHSGPAEERDGDFFGTSLSRASRLMSAAHGGQVLVSLVSEGLASPVLPEDVELRSLGEHRLRDFVQPELVYQLVASGLQTDFPPLRTPQLATHNLPSLPTSFVGRSQEVVDVEDLVRAERLVTLIGAGGAGKTRLALEVGTILSPEFVDGVWLVSLGAVTDPQLVATEVAKALQVKERPGEPVLETVLEYLRDKELLLLVDNCEHLIEAVAALATELLMGAPMCRTLATSREVFGVGGEVIYRLQPMSLPDNATGIGLPDLERYDALRLFIERATAANPGFAVTAESAPAIAEICQRLDGIPLAIELAAARVRTFTPRQISDNLDESFRLLVGGSRSADPRQQTLAAAIDWSYRLLNEREQILFVRLSVFQGGFGFEAAQRVCTDSRLTELDVLEHLPALVDKSLVIVEVSGQDSRYRVLEMLRQFAMDKLVATSEFDQIRESHANYFMKLAEAAEPHVRGDKEEEWWDRLDVELDNLRLAMEWSLDAQQPSVGMRLAGAIWRFWKVTFRYSEGVRWLSAMYETGGDADNLVSAKVMVGLGTLKSYTDDPGAAGPMLEEAISIYRELDAREGDPALLRHGYPSALISLGTNIWQYEQRFDKATELWEEALEIGWRVGDGAGVAMALGNLAEAAARSGDIEGARAGYIESVNASNAFNSTHSTVEAICLSAVFELSIDQPARAIPLFDEAIQLAQTTQLSFWVNFCEAMRAVASHDLGENGSQERFDASVAKLFADTEFQATFYYQLPLVLARADLEHSSGRSGRAVQLLGILETLEEKHSPLEPIFEGTRRKRLLTALTTELGDSGLRVGLKQGRALTRTERTEMIVGNLG